MRALGAVFADISKKIIFIRGFCPEFAKNGVN